MAEKIVSPGVFTNEKDLSFLPVGIASIGAVVIGPTNRGPAFTPTMITNFEDFKAKFGDLDETTYVPYTVKSYLRNASNVIVVRVVQDGGYSTGMVNIIASTGSVSRVVGSIHISANVGKADGYNLTGSTVSPASGQDSFGVVLVGGGVASQAFSASVVPTSTISFDKVLGTSVVGDKRTFMYTWFSEFLTRNPNATVTFESSSTQATLNLAGATYGAARKAATPYVTSQLLEGQDPQNLFRFIFQGEGADGNTACKVSIINTLMPGDDQASEYGAFTVLVRAYNDTDQRPNVLETFVGCNLDPDSVNYICRRIGDRYVVINSDNTITYAGNYENRSKYIYVQVTDDVAEKGIPASYRPYGFTPVMQTISSSYNQPVAKYVTNRKNESATGSAGTETVINGFYNTKAYYGWDFTAADNANYLKPVPAGTTAGANGYFNLDYCFIHPSASSVDDRTTGFVPSGSVSASILKGLDISNIAKFTLPLQDGYDGLDISLTRKVGADIQSNNIFGFNCSTSNTSGSRAYFKALGIIGNGEEFDINMIVTPGINATDHPAVVQKVIEVAEDRGDTFIIVDPVKQGMQLGDAIAAIGSANLDTNYAACYWPWVKIMDITRNKPVWVPPSVVLPGVYAYNDTVAYEWFAPAGLNRGGITEAVDVEQKLTFSQRDVLYENKINPLATFPNQGVCVWGQKTLQSKPSALDRINVRRLMIALKKYIASATRYLVFENNTTETRQRFLNIVNPYLDRVKSRQGLYAFRVVMDETNNTPDVIDRNQMYGQIFLQPARSSEFIILDFNILPTGASFENV